MSVEQVGQRFARGMVTVGLLRGRAPDGTALPRRSGRLAALVLVVTIAGVGYSMLHIVSAGSVLVPITLGDAQTQQGRGLRVTLPWPITQVVSMSVQTQSYTMSQTPQKGTDAAVLVLGSDGASGTVDATVQYRLNPAQATTVYTQLGRSFGPKFVQPVSRACVRAEFENYPMIDAATIDALAVSDGIAACIRSAIQPAGIQMRAFQMRQVVLASQIQGSINAKVQAQQNQQSQQYLVQAAQAQASIQRLQALATSQAQLIVACGGTPTTTKIDRQATPDVTPNLSAQCRPALLTEQELEYSYIQALRDIINSPNPPTVIMGSGSTPVVQLPSRTASSTATTAQPAPKASKQGSSKGRTTPTA